MEWIREHLFELIGVIATAIGGASWLFRLESQVKMNKELILAHDKSLADHIHDASQHANGKSVEMLERKVDRLNDELVDTRKSIEIKIDNLFEKLYDQKK